MRLSIVNIPAGLHAIITTLAKQQPTYRKLNKAREELIEVNFSKIIHE